MENAYPAVKNTMTASDELLKLKKFWSMVILLFQEPLFIRQYKANEMYNLDLN